MIGDTEFARFGERLARYDVLAAARRIQPGDEAAFPAADMKLPIGLRRASGAARIVARDLLAALGSDSEAPLARGPSRAAIWPNGIIGSLAHDEVFALAAAAKADAAVAIGVDIEPADALPSDVLEFALSARERASVGADAVAARLIFAAKEAVYKAINPFDGTPLEYEDIEIDLEGSAARLADGRTLSLVTERARRLLAAALWRPRQGESR